MQGHPTRSMGVCVCVCVSNNVRSRNLNNEAAQAQVWLLHLEKNANPSSTPPTYVCQLLIHRSL